MAKTVADALAAITGRNDSLTAQWETIIDAAIDEQFTGPGSRVVVGHTERLSPGVCAALTARYQAAGWQVTITHPSRDMRGEAVLGTIALQPA